MILMHRIINCSILTNCRTEFNPFYAEKLFVLNLMNMPNAKTKKIVRGIFKVPSVRVRVLGSGAVGGPSNVLIVSGRTRCLVNCGEGSQKLGSEYRFGLEKLSQIFITSPSWNNISGLLGVTLSNQNVNSGNFMIHGHQCIENVFSGVHKFIKKRNLKPKIIACKNYGIYSNEDISVKYVCLFTSSSRKFSSPDKGEISGIQNECIRNTEERSHSFTKNENDIILHKRRRRSSSEKPSESFQRSSKYVISYIFTTKSIPGTLLMNKCMEFGVPPGPLLGKLKSGENVILEDGTEVRSQDVKEPDLPGMNIIVVECPTEEYLDSLLEEPIYRNYTSGVEAAKAVIHFSSSHVLKNPKYQKWISLFDKETKHLFLNEDNKLSGSVAIHRQQFKLNYLHPEIFPLLQDSGIPDFPRGVNTTEHGHTLLPSPKDDSFQGIYSDVIYYKCEANSFINAETLCELSLKPKSNYDYSKCLVLKKQEFLNELFKDDIDGKIEKCKQKIEDLEQNLMANEKIYPKIVFLGTGSGIPSKVRNTSGILIFLEENKCIIFDCSENTYNQLVNFYDKEKVEKILRDLVAVYVSHLHIDHHMGLITLLKARKLAFNKVLQSQGSESKAETLQQNHQSEFQPAYLLAPFQILKWLNWYSEKFEDISDLYDLIPNAYLQEGSNELTETKQKCKESLNLKSLLTTSVCHCPSSFGVSIVHADGYKITYSGDTMPCDDLVKLGMDSDILIHEATFEDTFLYEAKMKYHSTTSGAINIGRKMNAKYILLTHFSQRYCYLPVIEESFKNLNIGIAFDFMEVPFNKLPLLPALLEPVQHIFSEHNTKLNSALEILNLKRKKANTGHLSPDSSGRPEIQSKIRKNNLYYKNQ